MNHPKARKLVLRRESLTVLNPAALQAVRGGTDLVTVDDPITAPPSYSTKTGPARLTQNTCLCSG
jgi:hypothetical protein